MNLDTAFIDTINKDFAALWRVKMEGNTLEVSTPYLYPNSTFVRVFMTTREERFIATADADIDEVVMEVLPEADWIKIDAEMAELAEEHKLKRGEHYGRPIYFKECTEDKMITSILFDVAAFASNAAALIIDRLSLEA